MTASHETNLQT